MNVLGIDCGLAITGWGVLQRGGNNGTPKVLGYGAIRTKAGRKLADRIKDIYDETADIIDKYKPDLVAIESIFYFKNQKTIMTVGQARGVIMLAASKRGLETVDYTPLQVKQAITGYGKASKSQVQKMIKILLKLDEIPRPDDVADALAVSYCHLNTNNRVVS